jgi:WD40 repeat protein
MASFFLSHSSMDRILVDRISDELRAVGFHSVFLDFDPERGIPAGRNWELELYSQLRRADAVVFVSSKASRDSKWCFAELALARSQGKPIFPVKIDDAGHPLLADIQWIDLTEEVEAGFTRLWASLKRHGFDPQNSFEWDSRQPPYRGLMSFRAEDAAVFFGRDDAISEVLERLRGKLERGLARCVAVVGPSGSGKSSVVRAGVIPRLRLLNEQWVTTDPFTPGAAPLSALARVLAIALDGSTGRREELTESIQRAPWELAEIARDLCAMTGGAQDSVLLILDQAEELITRAPADERIKLAEVLQNSLQHGAPLRVLLTLRSEFLGAFSQDPALAPFIEHPLVLGSLDRSRLPEVIEGPAQRAGLHFDPGLVQRIVEDTRGGDALPLLSYTLQQLFERRTPAGLITAPSYAELGGVSAALRNRADQAAEALAMEGLRDIVVPTLLRLVTIDDRNVPVRRPTALSSLRADEREVVNRFVQERLLTSRGDFNSAIVEVAHETLFDAWPPLRDGIEATREDLRTRAELERLARDWDAANRRDSYLLQGERLAGAQRWVTGSGASAELPLVVTFLERSAKHDEATLRRESQLLGERVLDRLDIDPERGILLAIAAVEEYTATPEVILALNVALQLSRVRGYLVGHRSAIHSVTFSPDGARLVTASEDGTARIWDSRNGRELVVLRGHEGAVRQAAYSPDGSRIVTAAEDGTARIWDSENGQELLVLLDNVDHDDGDDSDDGVTSAIYSPDGNFVITAGERFIRVWDAASGRLNEATTPGEVLRILRVAHSPTRRQLVASGFLPPLEVFAVSKRGKLTSTRLVKGHKSGAIYHVEYAPDGDRIVACSHDGNTLLWAHNGRQLLVISQNSEVRFAGFSPQGTEVVTGSSDGVARVWDASDGSELFDLAGHTSLVTWADYSPNGTRIATASWDGTARLWDATMEWGGVLIGVHDAPVWSAAFSPDGERVVTASEDATARVWERSSGRELLVLRGHGGTVYSAAFSPDGTRIVTACQDEYVRVWDSISGQNIFEWWQHNSPVNFAAFSPDGTRIVSGSAADLPAIMIWDARSGGSLLTLLVEDDSVLSVAFSPDSTRIVSASGAGIVRLWDARDGREILTLPHGNAVYFASFSPDGSRIVTGSANGMAQVWDAASGREVFHLAARPGQQSAIASAVYSPDGTRIVTGAGDGAVRVWDAAEGKELLILWCGEPVASATYSPDGTRIVTAARDGTARVWADRPLEDLVQHARKRVFRSLTDSERREYGLPASAPSVS